MPASKPHVVFGADSRRRGACGACGAGGKGLGGGFDHDSRGCEEE